MHSSLLQHRRCVLQGPAAAHSWPACSSRLFPSRRNSTCNQAASSSSSNSSNFGHRAVAAAAQPTAVITGCSTGIGRDTALKLAQNGWHVFAGARADADLQQLAQLHEGITPVRLDVTSQESIQAAQQQVQSAVGASGLQLLVNNAGIGMVSPVEFFELQGFRDVFEVNFMGAVATSQAFIPLLRAGQQRGRIVNISSVAGHLNMPVWSAYCSSKHALESFSDCLRYELQQFGVPVVLVKPGPVATPIWQKARDRSTVQVDQQRFAAAMEVYGDMIVGMREETKRSEEGAIPVSEVVSVIYEAATAEKPKIRYHVGDKAALTYTLKKLLPEGVWEGIMQSYFRKAMQQGTQQQQQEAGRAGVPVQAATAAAQQQGVSAEGSKV